MLATRNLHNLYTEQTDDLEVLGTVLVPAGATGQRFVCGLYENAMSPPTFKLDVQPDPGTSGAFVAKLERLSKDEDYMFVYFFDNRGSQNCRVTVSQQFET